jgi:hypothetical protein
VRSALPSRLSKNVATARCQDHLRESERNSVAQGGPLEAGSQVLVSSHRKLLSSRAMVVSVVATRDMIPAGTVEERKQTPEVSKAD